LGLVAVGAPTDYTAALSVKPRSQGVVDEPLDITQLSFEDALAELERIVRQLEDGKGKLDDAIAAYGRGVQLKRYCEGKLADAQSRVDKIVLAPDGTITAQPAEIG
jgi:exodeoxyribonuclease VII small subunit